MKVGIIYDFGINRGGGDFVMLNIIKALSNRGYDVSLVTSNPHGIYEAAKYFDEDVPSINIRYVRVPHILKHPYTIAYIANKVAKAEKYDIYVISDDIPKAISNQRGICYVHYSHASRFRFKMYTASKYRKSIKGRIIWSLHRIFFPMFFLKDSLPQNWLLIANSMVTRRHLAETFHIHDNSIALLNPPVASAKIYRVWRNSSVEKENLAVCIGRLEPDKGFIDVLKAVAKLKGKLRLSLMGFSDSEEEIVKAVKDLKLENNVELIVNADRKTIMERLIRAKAIVHPTPHEPFGIAVVEGMATGCIPVVRRGFNGPWMEITQEGHYGIGFNSIEELAEALESVIQFYDNVDPKAIASRALEFDETRFRQRFMEIFENFIAKQQSL